MGGFGALDLARLAPARFCAVGAHSAALWFRGADTPAGAFDNADDFERNDLLRFARERVLYRVPGWIDVGKADPFLEADTSLAHELKARGARVRLVAMAADTAAGQAGWGSTCASTRPRAADEAASAKRLACSPAPSGHRPRALARHNRGHAVRQPPRRLPPHDALHAQPPP